MRTGVKIRVIYLQAKESQGMPRMVGHDKKPGERHGVDSPSELPKGTDLSNTSILNF